MIQNIEIQSNKIKLVNLVWMILILELACIFFITYYFIAPKELTPSEKPVHLVVLYFCYLSSIISIPVVFKIYENSKKKAKKLNSESEKTENYFFIKLILFSIIEVLALFCLLAFYLNEMNQPLYMFGIVFVAALLIKPSKNQFTKDFLLEIDEDSSDEVVFMPEEVENLKDEESNEKA